jgi:hypothetical protein
MYMKSTYKPDSQSDKYYVIRIGGVMISILASSVVDRGFEHRSGKPKEYKIDSCYFSAKHAALRRKSKDWLARTQNNVSKWSNYIVTT